MNVNKDYYAILGVLPNAESVVSRAAYRALSKLYHPDVYSGNDAAQKMSDINEAYEIIVDGNKRQEYDKLRGNKSHDGNDYFNDTFTTKESRLDPLEKDWEIALKYYPDLENIVGKLSKVSYRLAYSFKAYLIDSKKFDDRINIARDIEIGFLHQYFGNNKQVIKFANFLIKQGRKDILKELNEVIRIIGSNNKLETIISKIAKDNGLEEWDWKDPSFF